MANQKTEGLKHRIIALLNNSTLPNAGNTIFILELCKQAGLKFVPDTFEIHDLDVDPNITKTYLIQCINSQIEEI